MHIFRGTVSRGTFLVFTVFFLLRGVPCDVDSTQSALMHCVTFV